MGLLDGRCRLKNAKPSPIMTLSMKNPNPKLQNVFKSKLQEFLSFRGFEQLFSLMCGLVMADQNLS